MKRKPSFLHKVGLLAGAVGTLATLAVPFCLAGIGFFAGGALASTLGLGILAGNLAAGIGCALGFTAVAGPIAYMAAVGDSLDSSSKSYRALESLLKVYSTPSEPIRYLENKISNAAYASDLTTSEKKRIKNAFNKAVFPSPLAQRTLNSGYLYTSIGIEASRNRHNKDMDKAVDSIITRIENKSYRMVDGIKYKA